MLGWIWHRVHMEEMRSASKIYVWEPQNVTRNIPEKILGK
jgi:hypothetical protein